MKRIEDLNGTLDLLVTGLISKDVSYSKKDFLITQIEKVVESILNVPLVIPPQEIETHVTVERI